MQKSISPFQLLKLASTSAPHI